MTLPIDPRGFPVTPPVFSHTGAHRRARWKAARCQEHPFCAYCGGRVGLGAGHGWMEATVDHIQPLAKSGRDEESNFALSCRACNQAKGNSRKLDPEKRRQLIAKRPIP